MEMLFITAATNWYWVTASDVDLVEALGAVQVALVNRINSQETGLAPGVGLAPLADGHCHWLGFGYRIAAPQVGIGLPQPVQMTMRRPVARNGGPQRPRIAAA